MRYGYFSTFIVLKYIYVCGFAFTRFINQHLHTWLSLTSLVFRTWCPNTITTAMLLQVRKPVEKGMTPSPLQSNPNQVPEHTCILNLGGKCWEMKNIHLWFDPDTFKIGLN